MKRALALAAILLLCYSISSNASEDKLQYGLFGPVTVYHSTPRPAHVVVFISGDAGWKLGVVDMARELTTMDALVVGVDIQHYFKKLEASKQKCFFPAGDFDSLGKFIEKKYGYASYVAPILIGYSSGATLAYGALIQAPPTTFSGAVSLGFCPDLEVSRPLCKANSLQEQEPLKKVKGFLLGAAHTLEAPWIVLQGQVDTICDPPSTKRFVEAVPGAELMDLQKVGHGFSVPKNWMPQFRDAFARVIRPRTPAAGGPVETHAADIKDLPMVEVKAGSEKSPYMAVILSGDGGWAGIDREIGAALAKSGVPVAGWNALQYFWTSRTPDATAADLQRILKHYIVTWDKQQVLLIGYSFGAEIMPFLVRRLPPELAAKVKEVVLISPSTKADFEFHFTDWLGSGGSYPVLPEVEKMKQAGGLLCIYGDEEDDSLCPALGAKLGKSIQLKGGHHLGGDYAAIAAMILKNVQ